MSSRTRAVATALGIAGAAVGVVLLPMFVNVVSRRGPLPTYWPYLIIGVPSAVLLLWVSKSATRWAAWTSFIVGTLMIVCVSVWWTFIAWPNELGFDYWGLALVGACHFTSGSLRLKALSRAPAALFILLGLCAMAYVAFVQAALLTACLSAMSRAGWSGTLDFAWLWTWLITWAVPVGAALLLSARRKQGAGTSLLSAKIMVCCSLAIADLHFTGWGTAHDLFLPTAAVLAFVGVRHLIRRETNQVLGIRPSSNNAPRGFGPCGPSR